MANKFLSSTNIKFAETLTGASGHFDDAVFLGDAFGSLRKIHGIAGNIYHDNVRLLKEGDIVAGATAATNLFISAYQANTFVTGDIIRYDATGKEYVKSRADSKANAEVIGVVDYVSGTHNWLKDESQFDHSVNGYYVDADTGIYKKVGTTSASFNSGNSLNYGFAQVQYHDSFSFGAGDFTVEMWFRAAGTIDPHVENSNYGVDSTPILISDSNSSSEKSFELRLTADRAVSGSLYTNNKTIKVYSTPGAFSLDTWNHIALNRNGTEVSVFLNGSTGHGTKMTTGISATDSLKDMTVQGSTVLGLGKDFNESKYYGGHIDELKITKGTAKYTNSFTTTLPTTRLDTDSTTSLMLRFDSGNSYFRSVGHGTIDFVDTSFSFQPGRVYFLDTETSGKHTLDEPVDEYEVSKPVFVALEAEKIFVHNYRGVEIVNAPNNIVRSVSTAPTSQNSPGTKNMIAYDEHYFYICVKSNAWKRTAIGGW